MTQPPQGGSVAPSSGSSDFGATTLSGRTATNHGGAPSGTATEPERTGSAGATSAGPANDRSGDAKARADVPMGAPTAVGTIPPPTAAPIGPDLGGPPTGSSAPIRGIRTGRNRGPRRARLQIRHINPVTVLKFSCVLSVALFFVWLIVIGVLFGILDAAGVIDDINKTVVQLNGTGSKPPVTAGIVFGGAAIIGVINIVLFIALSTIGSVIYNLCADLVGGIEITLSER